MPKYRFLLKNGKYLTLEGDTQPSDADVEAEAKTAGVTLFDPATDAPKTVAATEPDTYAGGVWKGLKEYASELPGRAIDAVPELAHGLTDAFNPVSYYEGAKSLYKTAGDVADLVKNPPPQGVFHASNGVPVLDPEVAKEFDLSDQDSGLYKTLTDPRTIGNLVAPKLGMKLAPKMPDALVRTGDVVERVGIKARPLWKAGVTGGIAGMAFNPETYSYAGAAVAAAPFVAEGVGKGMKFVGKRMGGSLRVVPEELLRTPTGQEVHDSTPTHSQAPPPSEAELQAYRDRMATPDPPDSANARGSQGPAPSEVDLQAIQDRMNAPDPPDSPNAQGSRGPEPPEGYGGYRPHAAVDSMEAALLQQKFDDAMSKRNLSYADEQIAAKANADRLRTIEAAKAGLVPGDPGISETTGATRPDGSKVSLRQSYGSPKPPKAAPQAAVVPTSPRQTPVAAAPPEAPMVEQMVAPEGVKPPTPAIDPEAQAIRDQTAERPADLPDPVGPVKEDPMVDELVKPKDVSTPLPEAWKALEKPEVKAGDPGWDASVAKKTGRHSDNTIDAAVDWALKNPGKTKAEVQTEMVVQKGMRHVIRHETPRAAKGLRVISDVARDNFKSLGYSDEDLAYMTPEQAAKKMQVELDKRNVDNR